MKLLTKRTKYANTALALLCGIMAIMFIQIFTTEAFVVVLTTLVARLTFDVWSDE